MSAAPEAHLLCARPTVRLGSDPQPQQSPQLARGSSGRVHEAVEHLVCAGGVGAQFATAFVVAAGRLAGDQRRFLSFALRFPHWRPAHQGDE